MIFKTIYDTIIKILVNNPITRNYKIQKVESVLEICDIDKVKEMTVDHYIDKDNVFVNTGNDKTDEILNRFLDTMNKNFDREDLKNLYDNIIWVLLKKKFRFKNHGDYDLIDNVIKGNEEDVITYELLHLSSNPYDETSDYCGFSYTIDNYLIGIGLDEGYTELLNRRYFNSETKTSYENQIITCEYLEKIVGQKNMEKMYLNANLHGLIKELKKYYSLQEIERFIIAVDFTEQYDYKKLSIYENDALCEQFETIISFLFKGYCKLLKNKNIEKECLGLYINSYINEITKKYNIEVEDSFIEELQLIVSKELNESVKINIETNELKR